VAWHHPDLEQLGLHALNLLDTRETVALESHLRECPPCRRQAEQLRTLVEFLPQAAPVAETPPHLREQVLSRIGLRRVVPPDR
jgi:predicted anti-sigma-YlaC factor YlaD